MPNGQFEPTNWAARGDWFKARGSQSRIRLKSYWTSPSQGMHNPTRAYPEEKISKNVFIGPVHASRKEEHFVSVQVPHPNHRHDLVWINVWSDRDGRPVYYAHKVARWMILEWISNGWQDVYVNADHGGGTNGS